jgi:hypothetical protein
VADAAAVAAPMMAPPPPRVNKRAREEPVAEVQDLRSVEQRTEHAWERLQRVLREGEGEHSKRREKPAPSRSPSPSPSSEEVRCVDEPTIGRRERLDRDSPECPSSLVHQYVSASPGCTLAPSKPHLGSHQSNPPEAVVTHSCRVHSC